MLFWAKKDVAGRARTSGKRKMKAEAAASAGDLPEI